jgi:hypothetical protein
MHFKNKIKSHSEAEQGSHICPNVSKECVLIEFCIIFLQKKIVKQLSFWFTLVNPTLKSGRKPLIFFKNSLSYKMCIPS